MGFKSNINYAAYEGLRQRGGEGLTRAKYFKKKEEEEEARRAAAEAKAAATRRSGQRSGLHKLGSAALRAGAAYYTGGASEALGFGGAIDDVILGTDDQGRSVRNEYGELVRAGTGIYGAMKSKKAGDVARKRASNIRDYEEQVTLAKDMGVFDPVLGKNMLEKARDTRWAQKQQTQAGEDASLFGWDNEFDELALSPAQIAGKEQADLKIAQEQAFKAAPIVSDPMQRRIATGDVTPELADTTIQRYSPEREDIITRQRINEQFPEHQSELDKVEEMYERDRKRAFVDDPNLDSPITPSTRLNEQYHKERMLDEMMDTEYNKRIDRRSGDYLKPAFDSGKYEPYLAYEDESNREGRRALEKPFKGSLITPYKTYSEKEAEKLSRKDSEDYIKGMYRGRPSELDDIAFDTKGRALEERYSGLTGEAFKKYDSAFRPEDEQHFLEYMLRQKAELAREHERTGGPYGGEWLKRGQRPESKLLKRIKARRKGSILHGDGV